MIRMAAVERWTDRHYARGKWAERVTDQERELYERALNAASEAEREGDAQLQAAVAAAQVVNRAVVAPTHLHSLSLKFECSRLEAAYRRKSATNSGCYDYITVLFKLALLVPHLFLCVLWLRSPTRLAFERNGLSSSQPELTFHESWSVIAAINCVIVLGVQLVWPLWYRSNRGSTLKYFAISLWIWETVKVVLNTNDMKIILLEVVFVNVFMSLIHGMPFLAHLHLRSYGGLMQSVAIAYRAFNLKFCLEGLFLALIGHICGLGLAYLLDRHSRKQFLLSLPSWLLDDLGGQRGPSTYRASLSRQMWSIFYPELLDNSETVDQTATNGQFLPPRRALGGFAGGFGGVSSLKCAGPVSNISTISSSSSLSEDASSDDSSGHWGGGGPTGSGISCGETAPEHSENATRASVQWSLAATTSACSQSGMEPVQPGYIRNRAMSGRTLSRSSY